MAKLSSTLFGLTCCLLHFLFIVRPVGGQYLPLPPEEYGFRTLFYMPQDLHTHDSGRRVPSLFYLDEDITQGSLQNLFSTLEGSEGTQDRKDTSGDLGAPAGEDSDKKILEEQSNQVSRKDKEINKLSNKKKTAHPRISITPLFELPSFKPSHMKQSGNRKKQKQELGGLGLQPPTFEFHHISKKPPKEKKRSGKKVTQNAESSMSEQKENIKDGEALTIARNMDREMREFNPKRAKREVNSGVSQKKKKDTEELKVTADPEETSPDSSMDLIAGNSTTGSEPEELPTPQAFFWKESIKDGEALTIARNMDKEMRELNPKRAKREVNSGVSQKKKKDTEEVKVTTDPEETSTDSSMDLIAGNSTTGSEPEELPTPQAFFWKTTRPQTKIITIPGRRMFGGPFQMSASQINRRLVGERRRIDRPASKLSTPRIKRRRKYVRKSPDVRRIYNSYVDEDQVYYLVDGDKYEAPRRKIHQDFYDKSNHGEDYELLPVRPYRILRPSFGGLDIPQERSGIESVPILGKLVSSGSSLLSFLNPFNFFSKKDISSKDISRTYFYNTPYSRPYSRRPSYHGLIGYEDIYIDDKYSRKDSAKPKSKYKYKYEEPDVYEGYNYGTDPLQSSTSDDQKNLYSRSRYMTDFPLREDLYVGKDGNIYIRSEDNEQHLSKNYGEENVSPSELTDGYEDELFGLKMYGMDSPQYMNHFQKKDELDVSKYRYKNDYKDTFDNNLELEYSDGGDGFYKRYNKRDRPESTKDFGFSTGYDDFKKGEVGYDYGDKFTDEYNTEVDSGSYKKYINSDDLRYSDGSRRRRRLRKRRGNSFNIHVGNGRPMSKLATGS